MRPRSCAGIPEQRHVPTAQITRRARDRRRLAEPRERRLRDALHRHETLEILRQHVVHGNGERGLVALPALERRAIRRREERDADADDEERRRDDRSPASARERERGQPERQRPVRTPERAKARCDEPGREHRCGEDDERRKQQQERSRTAADRVRARVTAGRGEQNGRDGSDRRDVRGRQCPGSEGREPCT